MFVGGLKHTDIQMKSDRIFFYFLIFKHSHIPWKYGPLIKRKICLSITCSIIWNMHSSGSLARQALSRSLCVIVSGPSPVNWVTFTWCPDQTVIPNDRKFTELLSQKQIRYFMPQCLSVTKLFSGCRTDNRLGIFLFSLFGGRTSWILDLVYCYQ